MNIKSILPYSLLLVLLLTTLLVAADKDAILGNYHLPNDLDIEIYATSSGYEGKIIALNNYENGITTDVKNPDKSKRDTPLLGAVIIKGLAFDAESKEWVDGSMYGPNKGITVKLTVTEATAKGASIVGSKFVMKKKMFWERVQ